MPISFPTSTYHVFAPSKLYLYVSISLWFIECAKSLQADWKPFINEYFLYFEGFNMYYRKDSKESPSYILWFNVSNIFLSNMISSGIYIFTHFQKFQYLQLQSHVQWILSYKKVLYGNRKDMSFHIAPQNEIYWSLVWWALWLRYRTSPSSSMLWKFCIQILLHINRPLERSALFLYNWRSWQVYYLCHSTVARHSKYIDTKLPAIIKSGGAIVRLARSRDLTA